MGTLVYDFGFLAGDVGKWVIDKVRSSLKPPRRGRALGPISSSSSLNSCPWASAQRVRRNAFDNVVLVIDSNANESGPP